MPQIPTINPPIEAPTRSGIGLRAQRAPSVGSPEASQEVGSLLGRSMQGLGQDLLRTSEMQQHRAEIEAHTQRAQDTLDAKSQLYEYLPQLQTAYDELAQGDYRTLPESVLERGKGLIAQMSLGMRPGAAALFKDEAMQRLAVVQQKALTERTQRRDSDTLYTLSRATEQARVDAENAGNDAEFAEATARYEQLNRDMVQSGLLRGDVAAKNVADMHRVAQETLTARWIEHNPGKAAEHFEALLAGKPGVEGGPTVPKGREKDYHDLAQKELRESLQMADLERQAAERQVNEGQDRIEREMTNQVMEATNVKALMGLQRTVGQLALDESAGGVGSAGQRRLFSMIHARIEDMKREAKEGAGESNEAVLTQYGLTIAMGRGKRTPAETQRLMEDTAKRIERGEIKWKKGGSSFIAALQEELREDAPFRLPEVQRQRAELEREMETTSKFAFDETAHSRTIVALREYDDDVRKVSETQGPFEAQKFAEQKRRELADTFATNTLRKIHTTLQIPPRDLPPGLLNEEGLPQSHQVIEERYGKAKQEIIRRYDAQKDSPGAKDEAVRHLGTLDQRKKWWEHLLEQNPPRPPAKEQQSFLKRLGIDTSKWLPGKKAAETPGGFERER